MEGRRIPITLAVHDLLLYGPHTVAIPLSVNRLVSEHLEVIPTPLTPALCGDPDALSVITTESSRVPVTVGVKVTLMVQVSPTPRVLPQVLVWLKLVPLLMAMEDMDSVPVPLFFRIIGTATLLVEVSWEPKISAAGVNVTAGTPVAPVPVSGTVCGLPVAVSVY